MSDQWPGVSARGVLEGRADALAGLCDSRGRSVVGYCACVCGPERAVEAAAAAFAAFRAGAVRSPDPLSIDPEALLLGRTRAAAAQRAPKPAASLVFAEIPCTQIPALLAENATGSLSAADQDRLRQHLARCVACQAMQGVREQAERTYFDPTADAVDPVSRLEIIEALGRAVPQPGPSRPTAGSANGGRPAAEPAAARVPPGQPRIPQPLPRSAAVTGSKLTSTPVGQLPSPGPPAASPPRPQPSTHPGAQPSTPAPPQPSNDVRAPVPVEVLHSSAPGAAWDSPTGVMSAVDLGAALDHQPPAADPPPPPGWAGDDGASAEAGGPPDDRSGRRRMAGPFAIAGVRSLTVPRVLGPVAVLVVGLLVALFVAGVFTGGSPHPSTDPLSGAQTDPSTAIPTTGADTSGGTAIGGGSTASGRSAASAGTTTAATRAAARKRADALARKLRAAAATRNAAGGNATAGVTPSTNPSATTHTPAGTGTSPTAGTPAAKPTTATAAPTQPASSGPGTIHELGSGAGSAKPVTGVPATGATGYQPG